MQQLLPSIPLEAYNMTLQELVNRTDTNLVVLAISPDKEGLEIPTEQQLLNAIHTAQKMQLDPWVDNVKTGPLIENMPAAGTIKKEVDGPFGSKILTLSNGVTVVMKETDYKDDEIRMTAWSDGGSARYGLAERVNLAVFDAVVGRSKLGGFTQVELGKALAGKTASASAGVGGRQESVGGSSNKKDVQTMFELIYLNFQPREKDEDAVGAYLASLRESLRNKKLNPMSSLSDSIQMTIYNHNPLITPLAEEEVDKVDYDRILQIYADRFADASDFTFLFIGNINPDQIRELSKQYLATLPTMKRSDKPVDSGLRVVKGDVINRYQKKMETPQSYIVSVWSGPIKLTVKNNAVIDILGTCLSEVYLKKIREEIGAAYSTHASGDITRGADDKTIYEVVTAFPLKPEMTDTCLQIVQEVFEDMAANGPAEESISKAKEYMLKTFAQNQRENGYWMGRLTSVLRRKYDPSENYEAVISSITAADIQEMAKTILKNGNRVRVVMEPEQ